MPFTSKPVKNMTEDRAIQEFLVVVKGLLPLAQNTCERLHELPASEITHRAIEETEMKIAVAKSLVAKYEG